MIIDHIGIAVKSLEESICHWENVFGYIQITSIVLNTRQKVRVVFLEKKGSTTIKLIEPSDESSPIHSFTKRGGGLHHLCFKCKDIESSLVKLTENGLRILAKPQPGEAFENENIAFLYAKNGLNIEIISTDKRANRIPK